GHTLRVRPRPDDRTHDPAPTRPQMKDADFPGNDAETWDLFVRYQRSRARSLRNDLIERHMSLAEGLGGPAPGAPQRPDRAAHVARRGAGATVRAARRALRRSAPGRDAGSAQGRRPVRPG